MIKINFTRKNQIFHVIETKEATTIPSKISDFISQLDNPKGVKTQVVIEGDLGATMGYGGDRYPYTVHSISNDGKTVMFSADDHSWNPETKNYDYSNRHSLNPNMWQTAKLKKDGHFRQGNSKGPILSIGYRRFYQDPHF